MRARLFLPLAVFGLLAGCGNDSAPPPKVARESAGVQVRRVATQWGDTVSEEGFLEGDPNGVSEFHVVTRRTFVLTDDSRVNVHIERDEVYTTKLGPFRCKAKGDLKGAVRYAWVSDEAEVALTLGPAELPRTCDRPGFAVMSKSLGETKLTLYLRSDQLIAKTSARDRTVLLPLQ